MSILWYNGVQRARHLLPTISLLSICAGYIINHLNDRKIIGRKFVLSLIIFFSVFNIMPWAYVNFYSVDRFNYLLNRDLDQFLEKNLDKWKWYPNFTITKTVKNELSNDVKIAALSTGNSYYLERIFYGARRTLLGPSFIESKNDVTKGAFLKKLKNHGITHIFLNDYVIEKWNLQDCWLNDNGFKKETMSIIIANEGQSLYQLRYE